ncbi:MAG: hypothetical protein HRU70_01540 [Phycisphaeraceae bacterium]|nr:MAG: hypothetical protein HRU70_01540 [Phycisphaeraceae bacterium]
MPLRTSVRFRPVILSVIAALGACGFAPASAQDSTLRVVASPRVVYSGERATVDVLAEFPSRNFAFASARFDVCATHPAWTFVSGGALVGTDVLGIVAAQQHRPQSGMLANPLNPHPVWHGVYSPASDAPALVRFGASPSELSVYPSRHSPSAVRVEASGGAGYVLANPLRAGRWLAAPGAGSEIAVRSGRGTTDDVIVDGRIITGEHNPATPILIGLLLPAVQVARESTTRVEIDGVPSQYRASVQVEHGDVPTETHSINFGRIDIGNGAVGMSLLAGTSAGATATVGAYLGGVFVATADVNSSSPGSTPTIILDSIAPSARVRLSGVGDGRVHWMLKYDAPVRAMIRGRDGRARTYTIDAVEIVTPMTRHSTGARGPANIKQLGLALHTFEAAGARGLRVRPAQPR